jgi:hypothetical protein
MSCWFGAPYTLVWEPLVWDNPLPTQAEAFERAITGDTRDAARTLAISRICFASVSLEAFDQGGCGE